MMQIRAIISYLPKFKFILLLLFESMQHISSDVLTRKVEKNRPKSIYPSLKSHVIFDWFWRLPDVQKQSRKLFSLLSNSCMRCQRPSCAQSPQSHDNKKQNRWPSAGVYISHFDVRERASYIGTCDCTRLLFRMQNGHCTHIAFCFAARLPREREREKGKRAKSHFAFWTSRRRARSAHGILLPWGLLSSVETESFPDPWIFNFKVRVSDVYWEWYWCRFCYLYSTEKWVYKKK